MTKDEKELGKSAYDKYHELFRHYSSLLFQARVLIITLNLVLIGYNFGYLKVESSNSQGESTKGIVSYMSSIAILLLYSMETAYIKRLQDVAKSFSSLESGRTFFTDYKPMPHWSLIIFYCFSNILLLYKFIESFEFAWLSFPFLVIPFILFSYTFLNQMFPEWLGKIKGFLKKKQ